MDGRSKELVDVKLRAQIGWLDAVRVLSRSCKVVVYNKFLHWPRNQWNDWTQYALGRPCKNCQNLKAGWANAKIRSVYRQCVMELFPRSNIEILAKTERKDLKVFAKIDQGHIRFWFRKKNSILSHACVPVSNNSIVLCLKGHVNRPLWCRVLCRYICTLHWWGTLLICEKVAQQRFVYFLGDVVSLRQFFKCIHNKLVTFVGEISTSINNCASIIFL